MTLQEYLDSIHGKTVAVVGIGVSNTPLIRLPLSHHRRDRQRRKDHDHYHHRGAFEEGGAHRPCGR